MNTRIVLARHSLVARPLRGLSGSPHTSGELRRIRRQMQWDHLYRRLSPYLAAVAFAALVLVGWYAGGVLARAVMGVV